MHTAKPTSTRATSLFKRLIKQAALLLFAVLLTYSSAATQFTNEFWISTNVISGGGLGTLDSPFDGSTTNFDLRMTNMPENCTIHLLAGTYQTMGYTNGAPRGWYVKHGQRILGSGIDLTVIHLQLTNQGTVAIGSAFETNAQGCEISDMTVDLAGTLDTHGVQLYGVNNAIRRVKVLNATSTAPPNELFMLGIGPGNNLTGQGHGWGTIESCEVTNFTGYSCSAINLATGETGLVKNNRVFLQYYAQVGTGDQKALNFGDMRDLLVDGNYVNGAGRAVYSDGGSTTNVTIINNRFLNCDVSLGLYNNPHLNLIFCLNMVSSPNEPGGLVAIQLGNNSSVSNLLIAGNTFSFSSSPGGASYFINTTDFPNTTTGLTIVNNSIDGRYLASITNSTGVNVYNNTDLIGAPSAVFNQSTPPNGIVRKSLFANYTATYGDKYLGMKAGGKTVTLPLAAGHAGKEIIMADESGSNFIGLMQTTSPDTINGGSSVGYGFAPYASITAISDGTNWFARRKF